MSTGGWSSSGVPGMAIRQLMGTLSGAGSRLVSTASILSRSSDGFAQADDAAAAQRHAAALHGLDGVQPVLEGVRGDDLRVILRRRVDVVVVGGDARLLELRGLDVGKLAERDAHLHAQLRNLAHDVEHLLEFLRPRAHPAPRRAHAKTRRAVVLGAVRGGEHLVACP